LLTVMPTQSVNTAAVDQANALYVVLS